MPNRRQRRQQRFASEAALQALVRFGPEESGLAELIRQARGDLSSGIQSARGTARSVVGAVNRARPEVAEVYSDAGTRQAGIESRVDAEVAGMEGVPASIQAAIAGEQGAAASRIGESRADALRDLSTRKVAAQQGKQAQVANVRRQFVEDITKVLARRQSLLQEKGAFTAATAGQLSESAKQRRQQLKISQGGWTQQERNSLRSAGIDPDTGVSIPGGPLDKDANKKPGDQSTPTSGGSKREPLTKLQQAAAADTVGDALRWGKRMSKRDVPIEDARDLLSKGRDAKPVFEEVDDGKGGKKRQKVLNPDGTEKMTAEIPSYTSQLLLAAALEQAYFGHIRKDTQRKLRRRGLPIRNLPVKPFRPTASAPPNPNFAPGPSGQSRPN